ncbi:hypothetical protein FACS1894145_1220 [Bacteroidia bacterium]|nr:hypothetical protein FACS1894145_1220 [Bacteroidia bacterium]
MQMSAQSSYATRVIKFMPAPGQFTNEAIAQSNSAEKILETTGGMISLGSFGGYVILGFDQPIANNPKNPYGVDFSIKGNSFAANLYGVWTEPAAVQVMKDLNKNGVPDDGEWYELAGSDYYMSATKKNVEMTYYNPNYDVRYTIPWNTNSGETGALLSNQFHSHAYYPDPFDFGCSKDSLTYTGNLIISSLDMSTPSYVEFYRAPAFGYCDSRGNSADLTNPQNPYFKDEKGAAADGFDISWAVDRNGNRVDLDEIDFVKIYTAGSANAGWLGEWSSEVLGAGITTPDPNYVPKDYYLNYIGITQLKVLKGKTCQYEGFLFKNGLPQTTGTPRWWTSDRSVGTVDNTGLFTAKKDGETWLYFSQKENIPTDSIRIQIVELKNVILEMEGNSASSSDSTGLIAGETISITAQGQDNISDILNGSTSNRFVYDSYTWTTSNPAIGTIHNGLFKGAQPGRTLVYARSVSNPALADSILVIVKPIPEAKPVSNPVRIPYYAATGTKKSSELFATGTNSTTYLHSAVSKNGRITPVITKNVLNYSITEGNYGKDTLTFNITSYGVTKDTDVVFVYEPDAYAAPKQLLFVDESAGDAGKQFLKAWLPASNETRTLLEQTSIHDIAIDGALAYLAADNYVGRYNITSYKFLQKHEKVGNSNDKLVVYNNLLLVAGHNTSEAYLTVYNKTDLSVVKQITLSGEITDIVTLNGKAYTMINKGESSSMAIVNLTNFSLEKEVPLNEQGLNVSTLLVRGTNIYGTRGYTHTNESAVLVFNTTNHSYSMVTTGGFETLFAHVPAAIEPMTGDSILLVNGNGFTAYDVAKRELKNGVVMSKNGLYPTGSVYDTEEGKYYVAYSNAEGQNATGRIFNAQFNETGTISGMGILPNTLKISSPITMNEAPQPASTSLANSTIYEKATSVTAITINKTAFTDKENNFAIYVRDISQYASWLSIDPTYTTNGGIRLQAKYTETVDTDSVVTITVEAIDNYGFSATRTFTITIKPRVYKPVVANPIPDITASLNSEAITIPTANVFTNTAASGVTFTQSVTGNSNPELVTATPGDGELILSFSPDKIGEATVTLRETASHSTYGEKYVETSFKAIVTFRDGISAIEKSEIVAYPNPFAEFIVIETAANGQAAIYDITGKQVLTVHVKAGNNTMNTAALAKGIYILKLNENILKIVKK